jgi:hypothetical protein
LGKFLIEIWVNLGTFPAVYQEKKRKEKKRKDSAGSGDTASMIK